MVRSPPELRVVEPVAAEDRELELEMRDAGEPADEDRRESGESCEPTQTSFNPENAIAQHDNGECH
jgi:hypothetical protein